MAKDIADQGYHVNRGKTLVTTKSSRSKTPGGKVTPGNNDKNRVKKGVVLLGDIRLYDPVAPGGVWDEDDIETIDLLKKALVELKDYEFTFLDNHKTLLDDLRALKGKVDIAFNLLDEGYYNDPRKELHVAALLEILGIPYTGASPQSMAIRLDKSIMKASLTSSASPWPRAC